MKHPRAGLCPSPPPGGDASGPAKPVPRHPSMDAAATLPGWATGLWPAPMDTLPVPLEAQARAIAFTPMTEADLDAVHAVETSAYGHPWSPRHFRDSLQAGYPAVMLIGEAHAGESPWPPRPDGRWLLGYLVAMPVVDEVHLLNLTTAPAHRRQGHAQRLMQALLDWACRRQAQSLWLEVRESNAPARALYDRLGFATVGRRKGYYPDIGSRREDALVMQRPISPGAAPAAAATALRFQDPCHA